MGQETIIAWTDHTFNIAWGCTKVSPGCANCYAERFASNKNMSHWGQSPRRILSPDHWRGPIAWNRLAIADGRRHRVFCGSMCDIMEDHPQIAHERSKLWSLIRQTPMLDWQLLTKRPENYARFLPDTWGDGWPGVWLGASIESNDYISRADHLRNIPAVVRFISYEPALGPLPDLDLAGIDWVIYGGESGPGYRQHDLEWPRQMEAKCGQAGCAFFFKQSSAPRTEMGITLDGRLIRKYPVPREVATCPA